MDLMKKILINNFNKILKNIITESKDDIFMENSNIILNRININHIPENIKFELNNKKYINNDISLKIKSYDNNYFITFMEN